MSEPFKDEDAGDRSIDLSGISVCVVSCHFRPEVTGSGPLNSTLVDVLTQAGASVEVVAGIPHYPQWKLMDERYRRGLRWRETDGTAKLTRVRHAIPSRQGLVGRMRIESSFALLSAPYVMRSTADVIVAVTPLVGAMAAAQAGRRGRPLGVIVHDLSGNGVVQSATAGASAARIVGAAECAMLARCTKVGVITPRFVQTLTDNGVAPDRITDLPICSRVDRSELTRNTARQRLGWNARGMTVVHTGNMGMKQGLEHLLAAARLADQTKQDTQFVLVGDGNQRRMLEDNAADLANVRFIDPVSEQDYPTVLAAADVLLLHERPGVTEMSLPSKLTSYVTARRPILAAVDDGGISKTLLDSYEAALTVPNGDPQALLAGIRALEEDTALGTKLVTGAERMAAAEFGSERAHLSLQRFVRDLSSHI